MLLNGCAREIHGNGRKLIVKLTHPKLTIVIIKGEGAYSRGMLRLGQGFQVLMKGGVRVYSRGMFSLG